ncbi:hypothetical protein HHK36_020194 [Tetracentron sinense]|uniref:SWIM-type domain-containing protein n=1 Tax=Tetracentron sinense TaxID=13715 RepID=A0A835DAQ5_TETSI|nr:hypothetical protein HHK36_020194 [Tetracentron sinense]
MAGPSTHYDIDDDDVFDLYDESSLGHFVNGINYEDVMELEFASEAEGYEFYNSYARSMGFSTRKDNVVRFRGHVITSRRFVCSRRGHRLKKYMELDGRMRKPRPLSRCGCNASLVINLDKITGRWNVKEFKPEHNHQFAHPAEVNHLRSHRRMDEVQKAEIEALVGSGIRTRQVMDLMLKNAGGYKNLGFTQMDMYNQVNRQQREKLEDGDVQETPQEWEESWVALLQSHSLENNTWAKKLYKTKELWADPYLQGHYFAGMRSTQRSENMNAVFRKVFDRHTPLFKFIELFDKAIGRMREAEAREDCITNQTAPVLLSNMASLECHASQIYTANMFKVVQQELLNEGKNVIVAVEEFEGNPRYIISVYDNPQLRYLVDCSTTYQNFKCTCSLFETVGIPCSHITTIMKVEQLTKLPNSIIMTRWTKMAKGGTSSGGGDMYRAPDSPKTIRHRNLLNACNHLSLVAVESEESYDDTMCIISQQMKRVCMNEDVSEQEENRESPINKNVDAIRDPVRVRTKGQPCKRLKSHLEKKKRRCSLCRKEGHTRPKCPNKGDDIEDNAFQEEPTTLEPILEPTQVPGGHQVPPPPRTYCMPPIPPQYGPYHPYMYPHGTQEVPPPFPSSGAIPHYMYLTYWTQPL